MNRIADQMKSASQLATEEIRKMIQQGTLEPDQRVSIELLAEELGVSRTPVREAMQRLEIDGLVEVIPRIGVRVRTITTEEASDVYLLKAAIEPLAARWAAERSVAMVRQRLPPLLEQMQAAVEAAEVLYYAELVEQFHVALIEAAQSSALADMWGVISSRVHRLRLLNLSQPGRLDTSLKHHRDLAAAVSTGDGDIAATTMTDHMRDAHESALRAVASGS